MYVPEVSFTMLKALIRTIKQEPRYPKLQNETLTGSLLMGHSRHFLLHAHFLGKMNARE